MLLTQMSEPRVGSRGAERVRLDVMIDARAGHSRMRAEVVDCSATGIRLRTLDKLKIGQTFWVKLPGLDAKELEVVRVDGVRSGCQFREPIDPRVFKSILWPTKDHQPATVVDRRLVRHFV